MKAGSKDVDSMYPIGTKVIVETCSGEYRGKITAHKPWGFDLIKNAYEVHGPDILTTTKHVTIDKGQVLRKGDTCDTCETNVYLKQRSNS